MGELSADQMRERLQFYRAYWMHVLQGCLGWSAKSAQEYADRQLEGLPVVLHERAGWWIVDFFIPESAATLSPERVNELSTQLLEAIDPGDTYDPRLPDCAAISARAREVLHNFGQPARADQP